MKKKAATKEPFLPLFFGDFLGATAEWDGEERALYLLLLGYQWTGGTLPNDPRKLRKLVDYQESNFERWWPTVSTKFEVRGSRLMNSRLEVHRAKTKELSAKNSASGKKGAAARWEGTDEDMANAIKKDGERHGSDMASATNKSGERHKVAIPKRHPNTDGATDGNPSDPIPSHPIPSGDRSSQIPSIASPEESAASPEVAQMRAAGAMAKALRSVDVRAQSDHPTLMGWVQDRFTVERVLEAVAIARMTPGKESGQLALNYINTILRDPGKTGSAHGINGTGQAAKTTETAAQREWRILREEGVREGFRMPRDNEQPEQYRQSLKQFQRDQASKAMERMQAMSGALKEMPK